MRKVLIMIVVFAIFLCSCKYMNVSDPSDDNATRFNNEQQDYKSPVQGSGQYSDAMEFKRGYYYEEDIVQNANLAVILATEIFSSIEKSSEYEDYIPRLVYYDDEDHLWIISFWSKNQPDNVLDGYEARIILDAKSGAVKSIYSNTPMPNAIFREYVRSGDGYDVSSDIS